MIISKRRSTRGIVLAAAMLALASVFPFDASAQAFPNRPLRLIYPYAAGSGPDILGRMIAVEAAKVLGQPIVYENRPGAQGRLGLQAIKDAPPDGHMLGIINDGVAISQPAQDPELKLEPGRDYAAVSNLFEAPLVLLGRPDLPFKDMKGFVAYAKANPAKLNVATATGASGHFLTERIVRALGIEVTIIGMKGGAENVTATLGGHTDLFFSTTSMKQNVDSGKLNALASSGRERWKPFAAAPTFRETGLQVVYATSFPLIAHAGTSRDSILKLHRAFEAGSRAPEVVKQMDDLAYTSAAAMSPDDVTALIKSEIAVWIPILRKAGAKPQ